MTTATPQPETHWWRVRIRLVGYPFSKSQLRKTLVFRAKSHKDAEKLAEKMWLKKWGFDHMGRSKPHGEFRFVKVVSIKGTTAPHNLESWQQQTTTRNRTERIAISKPTETPQALSWIEDPYAVLSAIGKMEGVAWLERQEYVPRDSAEFAFTFFGALPLAERLRDIPSGGESSQYATVYGDGGTHRYYLRQCGRVDFSQHHADPLDAEALIRKATKLGFNTF